MICRNCQADNPDIAKFCMNCGFSLQSVELQESRESTKEEHIPSVIEQYIPKELYKKNPNC